MRLADMTWPQVAALSRETPVVLSVAALEQHGHHLPVFTDSMLLGEIVRRAEEQTADRVLFAPLMWLGNSAHHLDFPGTMTASARTYIDLVSDMIENFLTHGFTRIVVINGHGGNIVPGQQALFEVRQRHRDRDDLLLLFSSYWALSTTPPAAETLVQQTMQHACEWETSMILALAPQLVGEYKQAPAVDASGTFDPVHRAWTTKDRSPIGHIGHPAAASAAKGQILFEYFSAQLVQLLNRVAEWNGSRWA